MNWRSWTVVVGVKFEDNPVFENRMDGDLAYEPLGEGRLVDLPERVKEAIRSGFKGNLR